MSNFQKVAFVLNQVGLPGSIDPQTVQGAIGRFGKPLTVLLPYEPEFSRMANQGRPGILEVARNPYDQRFPAFLIDNVRRGSERIGGKGVASAATDFAMLYKNGIWRNGKFLPSALKRVIGMDEQASEAMARPS